ncbi:MAG: hypothetical protein IJ227_04535, partial [Mogibacterium sp.]|nr:hypothetical protein [Mogibacterium sp.]
MIWKQAGDRKNPVDNKIAVGVLYGIMCIFSTHLGIDYGDMLVNVRDLGPLCAGLFFDPVSGIIAGIIGGAERYVAGTMFGVGTFTTVACSISTALAGFLAAFLRVFIFKNDRPNVAYSFFMGAFVEVFHMYAIFFTHRNELSKAYLVVKTCLVPMILFSAFGLSLVALAVRISAGEWRNPLKPIPKKEVPVSNRFQVWLFGVTVAVLLISFQFSYTMHSREAVLESGWDLDYTAEDITYAFTHIRARGGSAESFQHHVGYYGTFCIIDEDENVLAGTDFDKYYTPELGKLIKTHEINEHFRAKVYDEESLCLIQKPSDDTYLFLQIPMSEVFQMRDVKAYETILADILIFTIIYVLVSMLVEELVVNNLKEVNK